jgi:hypothetical protein
MVVHHADRFLALAFLLVLGAVAAYDLLAVFSSGAWVTVSEVIVQWSAQYPLVPLLAGVVIGHLFFPIPRRQ